MTEGTLQEERRQDHSEGVVGRSNPLMRWYRARGPLVKGISLIIAVVGFASAVLGIWQWVNDNIFDRGRPYLGAALANTDTHAEEGFASPFASASPSASPAAKEATSSSVHREEPANPLPNVEIDAHEVDVTGVRITEIRRGGPADRAGLKVGDIIVALGDTAVENSVQFERTLTADYEPGDTVRITFVRGMANYVTISEIDSKEVRVTLGRF